MSFPPSACAPKLFVPTELVLQTIGLRPAVDAQQSGQLMRGAVYKRGSTWTCHFDIDPDPLIGRRRQRTKGWLQDQYRDRPTRRTEASKPG